MIISISYTSCYCHCIPKFQQIYRTWDLFTTYILNNLQINQNTNSTVRKFGVLIMKQSWESTNVFLHILNRYFNLHSIALWSMLHHICTFWSTAMKEARAKYYFYYISWELCWLFSQKITLFTYHVVRM